jgi:hypothetical protein
VQDMEAAEERTSKAEVTLTEDVVTERSTLAIIFLSNTCISVLMLSCTLLAV